jgi:signal transduction histidine kinase
MWPQFHAPQDDHLSIYHTFQNYRQTWGMAIFTLMATALLPLVVMTLIYYQLTQRSIDTESLLRTERVASNARRAVTFFLEERLAALTFTVNEMGYERLSDPGHLTDVLRNLKLGFGGLTDLSVIADTGTQVAYAGPFNLEGKNYSNQPWFWDCVARNACVSEIFFGYRGVPHIVVAVKSTRPNGHFFIKPVYKEDSELVEHIDSIIEAVERCGTNTRQLLGFARRFDVQTQTINLRDMVFDVINFHKKEAEYRDISIHVAIPDTIPLIETDRGKLQQIILNLVNDAFQAIDNGCFLDIRARMDGDDRVRILIEENGCGIPEAHLSKIFEPFFTTKKEGQGTGLGLSITYGLVKKLHGDITVESQTGQGTIFMITLPVNAKKEIQT